MNPSEFEKGIMQAIGYKEFYDAYLYLINKMARLNLFTAEFFNHLE